ncbi:esterase-like activity of phytase family protein [Streptomyces sp. NPDC005438]|uniref:esterase-like activity of phytase family protein n=1 Tax=Streptomyces sp. NPDC005438 TaxID=3156880 RepID=UPI0033BAB4A8
MRDRSRGRLSLLPFLRESPDAVEGSPSSRFRWRPSTRLGTAAVAVLALAVGTPFVHRWSDSSPDPGVCSARASLLGFSDRLDGRVSGLSSVAMDGASRAVAVSDTTEGFEGRSARLYELAMGDPGKPDETRIIRSTALRLDKDESRAVGPFDPEAVVPEKGGKTVLVASGQEPSVSRFDRKSGRLLDTFKVPETDGGGVGYGLESMALSKDGRSLYVAQTGSVRGGVGDSRPQARVLHYKGSPGGRYRVEREFDYRPSLGTQLTDFTTTDDGDLLALERAYVKGKGYQVRVHRVSPGKAGDGRSTGTSSAPDSSAGAGERKWIFSLHRCPDQGAPAPGNRPHPLVHNVEGMALGPKLTTGRHRGRQVLYLVSDDTAPVKNYTRFYTVALDL